MTVAQHPISPSILFEQSYYDDVTNTLHLVFATTNGDTMAPVYEKVVSVDIEVSSVETF